MNVPEKFRRIIFVTVTSAATILSIVQLDLVGWVDPQIVCLGSKVATITETEIRNKRQNAKL